MVGFRLLWVAVILGVLQGSNALGMFEYHETKMVPIDRLFANLQRVQSQNTNDFEVTYRLARLHAMAYSIRPEEVTVRKEDENFPVFGSPGSDSGVPDRVITPESRQIQETSRQHLTNAILLFERAIVLLKKSTNTSEQTWMVLPTQLGLAWCLDQVGRRQEALSEYRKTLRIAWKLEVVGDFSFTEWVKDVWKDVRLQQNPLRPHYRGGVGPGVCYSEETIGYLLKLLDPVKDADEIAQLKKDQMTLISLPRAITPILIPLQSGCGLAELIDPSAQVTFDLDGSGLARKWGWITPKAAWLVSDIDGSGQVKSGLQMFGNVTFWIFWRDGYEALSALDDNGDGMLSGAELRGLALWSDHNGNGVSEPGEVCPLDAFGIVSLSCLGESHFSGILWNTAGVTFQNGESRPTYDWIATLAVDGAPGGVETTTPQKEVW
jgi:hypothetical protein